MGNISNFTDSEQLKTLKMECVLKVYIDNEIYQLGLQVVDLENTEERATLILKGVGKGGAEAPPRF